MTRDDDRGANDKLGLLDLLEGRRGHFRLESGHHGELWLDLDALFLHPARLAPFVDELARLLRQTADPDAICGPLLGGALIAGAIATLLDIELYVAAPVPPAKDEGELFRARYAVAAATRSRLRGRRVAVVDDVISAGSATRATISDVRASGAEVVALGALLVLGTSAADYTAQERLPLVHVIAMPNRLWEPERCPLCAAGEPLEQP